MRSRLRPNAVALEPESDAPKDTPVNALLIYPEFPDTFWSLRHALRFVGKKAVNDFFTYIENLECGVDLMSQKNYRLP